MVSAAKATAFDSIVNPPVPNEVAKTLAVVKAAAAAFRFPWRPTARTGRSIYLGLRSTSRPILALGMLSHIGAAMRAVRLIRSR